MRGLSCWLQTARVFPDHAALLAGHALIRGDRPWQAELRLRQSRWREQLGLAAGIHGEIPLGSKLPDNDRLSNFLTPRIADIVEQARKQPGALITAPRIYTNMLSSQPLAFNLFGELAADLELATAVGRRLWPDLLDRVDDVSFEWSPGRGDPRYLDNRSAFDVAFVGRSADGVRACVGIEVKYHEDMTQDPGSAANPRYGEVARASGVFRDPDEPALRARTLKQVWFDHLLALSMPGDGPDAVQRVRFVLLAPAINPEAAAVDVRYRAYLADALTYERRTLEEVAAVIGACTDAPWIEAFSTRYLRSSTGR